MNSFADTAKKLHLKDGKWNQAVTANCQTIEFFVFAAHLPSLVTWMIITWNKSALSLENGMGSSQILLQ
jgi:hypothetical protein